MNTVICETRPDLQQLLDTSTIRGVARSPFRVLLMFVADLPGGAVAWQVESRPAKAAAPARAAGAPPGG